MFTKEDFKNNKKRSPKEGRHLKKINSIKPDLTEVIEPESEESKKKTYMIKDRMGQIQVKARE